MSLLAAPEKDTSQMSGSPSQLSPSDADMSKRISGSSFGSWSDSPPPAYDGAPSYHDATASDSQTTFRPTSQLQIDASGIDFHMALCAPRLEATPVFRVHEGVSSSSQPETPAYVSLRLKKNSNSCALVRGQDPTATPLNSTIYRWGPGRPPRIRLFSSNSSSSVSVESAINDSHDECEEVVVKSRNPFSRTQRITNSFGTFQWRYADRAERKETFEADSLLVLEKLDQVPGSDGKKEKTYTRVAQLVRNGELRTTGSSRWMAGNGGRLMVDTTALTDVKGFDTTHFEAFVVAGCLCMLKREMDRMRDNSIAAVS